MTGKPDTTDAAVVVTGANGFLGRHVCRAALRRGLAVSAVVRGQAQAPAGTRRVSLDGQTSAERLHEMLAHATPEVVYHLAGTVDTRDPGRLYAANVCYAVALLEAAARVGRAREHAPVVVLVGSAAEYGVPTDPDGLVREGDPCRPVSAYGISKLAQTLHGLAAADSGLPVVIARVFNPIGADSPPSSAVGRFAHAVASLPPSGGTVTMGPLHATRDFTEVEATADALVALGLTPQARGRVVNVCSGEGRRLDDVVARIQAHAAAPCQVAIDASRGGTSTLDVVVGDTGRLRSMGITLRPADLDAIAPALLAHHRADAVHQGREP